MKRQEKSVTNLKYKKLTNKKNDVVNHKGEKMENILIK